MKRLTQLILTLFLPLTLYANTYADIAKEILNEFETKQINSPYGKELYQNVHEITKNFTDHLSFVELERFVPRIHLEYMAYYLTKTRPNVRIALIWPQTKGHDEEIHNHFKKFFHIHMYKRILLDENGALNFLDTLPNIDSSIAFDILFAPPQNKTVPLRVFLLEGDCSNTTECLKKMGCMAYITKDSTSTIELAKTVFNQNSIHCIRKRKRSEQAKHLKIPTSPTEQIILTGENVLFAYGILDSGSNASYSQKNPLNYVSQKKELYTFTETPEHYTNIGFNRYGSSKRTLTTDDLLYNPRYHFYFNGDRYTTPEATLFLETINPSKNSSFIKNEIKKIEL